MDDARCDRRVTHQDQRGIAGGVGELGFRDGFREQDKLKAPGTEFVIEQGTFDLPIGANDFEGLCHGQDIVGEAFPSQP